MATENFLPDEATFAALGNLPDDEPVVMLNLLELADDGGESYGKYGRVVLPQLQKRDAHILYNGAPLSDDPAAGHWDRVALVYYPSRAAFLDMMADPDYQAGLPYRTAGLKRTVLYAFKQAEFPGAPALDSITADGNDEIFGFNLLRFRPDGGRQVYQKYARAALPLIRELGGRPALVLQAHLPLVSEETWEDLYLVRYPRLEALEEMVASERWQKANEDRQRGLDLTWAFPTRQL